MPKKPGRKPRGKSKGFMNSQSLVVRSKYFENILHDVEEHPNYTNKKLYDEFVKPKDDLITFKSFTNWIAKWRNYKSEQVANITNDIIERAVQNKLEDETFKAVVDQVLIDKLKDPEAIKDLSLKEAFDVKNQTERMKREDQKIALKQKADQREESMFDMMMDDVMSGDMSEEDIIEAEYHEVSEPKALEGES